VAEQAASGTVQGAGGVGTGSLDLSAGGGEHLAHHGRTVSWIAISIITAGFVIGAIGLVPHPTWWLFWTGAGIALAGCIITATARTVQSDWY